MSSGKAWLALGWTVLQFSEMQLFHCNVRILSFHFFCLLKMHHQLFFFLVTVCCLKLQNPGGWKPKYKSCGHKVIFFAHIRFEDICRNGDMALLILKHDSGWRWTASCPCRFTPCKERTVLIKREGQFAPETV